MRYDWLSLLQQGIYKPGTGVSDSHRITVEHAGWARTYVLGVGDDPAALSVTNFDAAIKAGAMLIAGGPYIDFTVSCGVDSGGMGALVSCPSGTDVRLSIKVRSPAWMPVEEVRIIANGALLASYDSTTIPKVRATPAKFTSGGNTTRFRRTIKVSPTVDTYYIVEAGPKFPSTDITILPTPPPIVDIVQPGVVPNSITNPIFINTNGDSDFDPPGLLPPPAPKVVIAESRGFWSRLQDRLLALAARVRGEAVAQRLPGRMTGVTEAKKQEAIREGEYFPLYELQLPADAAAEFARQEAAEDAAKQQQAQPGGEPTNAQ
jgi:hypothetical protein